MNCKIPDIAIYITCLTFILLFQYCVTRSFWKVILYSAMIVFCNKYPIIKYKDTHNPVKIGTDLKYYLLLKLD